MLGLRNGDILWKYFTNKDNSVFIDISIRMINLCDIQLPYFFIVHFSGRVHLFWMELHKVNSRIRISIETIIESFWIYKISEMLYFLEEMEVIVILFIISIIINKITFCNELWYSSSMLSMELRVCTQFYLT